MKKHLKSVALIAACLLFAVLVGSDKVLKGFNLQIGPTGIGVIGDSFSEGYQCIGRGSELSFAWTEIAQDWRNINFGEMCDGYNVAVSGETTADIPNQVTRLIPPIQNNEIDKVIILIGGNDIRPICERRYTARELNRLQKAMLAQLENGANEIIDAGMSPSDLYMVNQLDRSQIKECAYAVQVTDFVTAINVKIEALTQRLGINLIIFQTAIDALETYRLPDGNFQIAEYLIRDESCDLPDCIFVADGHVNSAASAITFNSLFADILGVSPLSDEEIVMAAGLKPLPTPTATQPTPVPTITATPTIVATVMPTQTPVCCEPQPTVQFEATAIPDAQNLYLPLITK